jgi:hypothetical protein
MRNPRLPTALLLAACSLGVVGCSKPAQTTTATTVTTRAAAPPAPAPPSGGLSVAMATGPGVIGDTSQTAALSAPANSNGTTPAQGVIPPPSR